jgi:uncharacterized protein
MSDHEIAVIEAKARAYVGRDCGTRVAFDAVNKPMIRHWCEAMNNRNPAYLDEERAARSLRGHLIAPPTMLFAWTQEGYAAASVGRRQNVQSDLTQLFTDHGYTGTVGTNVTQEYCQDARIGDVIREHVVIAGISERKKTSRGVGYFIDFVHEFSNQRGELIGRQTFRILKFMPPADQQAAK